MLIVRQNMLLVCTNARCIHHCIEWKKFKLHKEHSFLSIKKPVKLKSYDLSKRYCAALINSKALCAILFPLISIYQICNSIALLIGLSN